MSELYEIARDLQISTDEVTTEYIFDLAETFNGCIVMDVESLHPLYSVRFDYEAGNTRVKEIDAIFETATPNERPRKFKLRRLEIWPDCAGRALRLTSRELRQLYNESLSRLKV